MITDRRPSREIDGKGRTVRKGRRVCGAGRTLFGRVVP